MTEQPASSRRYRFWITIIAIVIGLIFLYFYPPFEAYLAAAIPEIRFTNVIFWFTRNVAPSG